MNDPFLVEALESRELLAVTGTRDLLYVRVRFSDQTGYPESATTALSNTTSATNWITDWSGKNVKFNVKLAAVALTRSTSYYQSKGTGGIAADVDAALKSQGFSLSGIEHVSYRYNGPIGTFGGLGQVNGPKTWIRQSSASIIAHELGHNIGLGHAKFANPKDNTKPFGASTTSEYGDVFSNMGSGGSKDWNASEKYSRGWLGGTRTRVVDATKAGKYTVTLTSHDDASAYASSNVYLLKLNINSSTSYYVSYRHNPDAVFIHRGPASNPTSASLIDAKPGTETASDAGLALGKSITDPRGSGTADDIKISTVRAGTKVTITVTVGTTAAAVAAPATTLAKPSIASDPGSVIYDPFSVLGSAACLL